jgi:hypothetical protein
MNRSTDRRAAERGQAMLEFIFMIPLLLTFMFATLEFCAMFIQAHKLSSLSREAANAAYRECGPMTGARFDVCLDDLSEELGNGAAAMLPDFGAKGAVVTSVWGPDADGEPVLLRRTETGNGAHESAIEAENIDRDFLAGQGILVVGEAFYDYAPITPIRNILQLLSLPTSLRETTVY